MDFNHQSQIYDENYYEHGCGRPYHRNAEWLKFFGDIADGIVRQIAPRTVLDAGCAKGFLVEMLRARQVEAWGVDISEYAISTIPPEVRPYCWVGSVTEPFPQRYDLIVSIEVLEHLPPAEGEKAIANLCRHSDDIVFSSNPFDFEEMTHQNVQPANYWAERFARHGFYPDPTFDGAFLTPWAIRFRRLHENLPPVLGSYAQKLFDLSQEITRLNDEVAIQRQTLEGKDQIIAARESEIHEILNSRSWRMMQQAQKARLKLLPLGSRREMVVKRLVKAALAPLLGRRKRVPSPEQAAQAYQEWIATHEPSPADLDRQRSHEKNLAYRPLVSVIVPVYNTEPSVLEETIASVLAQTYTNWELCLVDGASTRKVVRETLRARAAQDPRVRVKALDENAGISGNTNQAVAMAEGEFLAFLDHDDRLSPDALYEVALRLNADRAIDVLYSDHDILTARDGRRGSPLFKPDWSPQIMLSSNYITHLTVIRAALAREAGGFDPESDGAQDWDLFLRVADRTTRIAHIPKILYHWRDSAGSTATNIYAKPYAPERQLRAIEKHLERKGLRAPKAFFDPSGFIRVRWDYPRDRLVSIIIPSRGSGPLLEKCVDSLLAKTRYPRFEILVMNNGEKGPDDFPYYQKIRQDARVRVLQYDRQPFNYSAINNEGARQARGDLLLFLNNDTEITTNDWLDELVMWCEHPDAGAVGAKLLKPDGSIQHAGIVLGMSGFAGHVFAGSPEGVFTPFGLPEWYRNYLAVTAACLMMKRTVFEQIGGMSEDFVLCGNDVEMCLRLNRAGLRVIYNPFARLLHHESATHQGSIPVADFHTSMPHYSPYLKTGDPFFNPNLSYWNTQPVLTQHGDPPPYDFAVRHLAMLDRKAK